MGGRGRNKMEEIEKLDKRNRKYKIVGIGKNNMGGTEKIR